MVMGLCSIFEVGPLAHNAREAHLTFKLPYGPSRVSTGEWGHVSALFYFIIILNFKKYIEVFLENLKVYVF